MLTVDLNLEELEVACRQELVTFYRTNQGNTYASYELFRRALAEEDAQALVVLLKIFRQQMTKWVLTHSYFMAIEGSVDDYISIAFTKFYFKTKGDDFNKFATLPRLLRYLKLCIHSAIMQEYRKKRPDTLDISNLEAQVSFEVKSCSVQYDELWAYLCTIIDNPIDQLLMRCAFIYDMKPTEIHKLHSDCWADARAVSVALYAIRQHLRKDPVLRQWYIESA